MVYLDEPVQRHAGLSMRLAAASQLAHECSRVTDWYDIQGLDKEVAGPRRDDCCQ